jgi:hypothetical protein
MDAGVYMFKEEPFLRKRATSKKCLQLPIPGTGGKLSHPTLPTLKGLLVRDILMLEDLDACICHFRQDTNDVVI